MAHVPHIASPVSWRVLSPSIQSKIHLRMTLCGGQCFHWHHTPRRTFLGAIDHCVFELREVHCSAKEVRRRCPRKQGADSATATVDDSDAVCCWIEYRKLWPQGSTESSSAQSAPAARQQSSSPSASLPTETDEEVLTRYLSLDVDLTALWLRWTDAPTTRQHPLVTHLIRSSEGAARITDDARKSSALLQECQHDAGAPAAMYTPIRHVRQDVHSCLFSFLCSQNNNVARITGMIYTLSRHYGDHLCDVQLATGAVRPPSAHNVSDSVRGDSRRKIGAGGTFGEAKHQAVRPPSSPSKQSNEQAAETEWLSVYSFPSLQQLATASEEELRRMGFGYRGRYVVEAAKTISAFSLPTSPAGQMITAIPTLPQKQHQTCLQTPFYADLLAHHGNLAYQRAQLQLLCGVGRKVADCVLLFSLAHSNLVPVDTHMAQVAVEYLATAAHVLPQPKNSSRKRFRHGDEATGVEKGEHFNGKSRAISWQKELLLWGEKAKRLKIKAAKTTPVKTSKSTRKKANSLEPSDQEAAEAAKLPVPPLYARHHDAIQQGFMELFGPHAGWAHSVLFYYRMRK
ncbi:putative mitochondrial 8-oxoguanine DNA glycosylase [Leptomonas pyrrhocoris]|uniref:DNA-(apurinic or apyrimidinic site) lyase n=1 Tax=Leptomonas pyrrhocoris TaxID=157538 RepID=A0A0M9G4S7_LEPPY|nr:putative mitochondrial 8-oxoguanine DNA glycosylase [Leptomonas pyrrhocoris]XP_015660703.1 putative mitochondrial 8-oxoguanine DNA glycosylase [Leptomonas pyrrhocoris]KPA82263.1 putative mitochondrial 8-oxoguanine DNA glycosylase [Leptomonas pyrrhocoris]KPA82264.1 putative mitochondrial 8-oxoguanine DNA glycosylase [Leptomonas pyrrhocoris]|eukprot:XP_015660702.1 putative mitochondrial 8-oxoguanine DNA glycosylase [Leptomonas pyrrhocoris]